MKNALLLAWFLKDPDTPTFNAWYSYYQMRILACILDVDPDLAPVARPNVVY